MMVQQYVLFSRWIPKLPANKAVKHKKNTNLYWKMVTHGHFFAAVRCKSLLILKEYAVVRLPSHQGGFVSDFVARLVSQRHFFVYIIEKKRIINIFCLFFFLSQTSFLKWVRPKETGCKKHTQGFLKAFGAIIFFSNGWNFLNDKVSIKIKKIQNGKCDTHNVGREKTIVVVHHQNTFKSCIKESGQFVINMIMLRSV